MRFAVTPYAGVWIEIWRRRPIPQPARSLPTRECGLKCHGRIDWRRLYQSLPTRECGLKSVIAPEKLNLLIVTPYAGVWIEMLSNGKDVLKVTVTPYAGVWIEIGDWCWYCDLP